jgi:hypothetical protein
MRERGDCPNLRAPDAAQRAALAKRCAAEPGPTLGRHGRALCRPSTHTRNRRSGMRPRGRRSETITPNRGYEFRVRAKTRAPK